MSCSQEGMSPKSEHTPTEVNNDPKYEGSDSSSSFGVSEDMTLHDYTCAYYHWNMTHKNALLTIEEVKTTLTDHIIHTKGNNYYTKNMDQINQYVTEKVQGNVVQKYLADSQKIFESSKSIFMNLCKCARAKVNLTPPPIASHVNGSSSHTSLELQKHVETSLFGSTFSESEPDE